MYNLIRFIQKNAFVIVFVLLEILCVVMLLTSQPYHSRAWLKTSNRMVGGIERTTSGIAEYFNLRDLNRELLDENARLKKKLAMYENDIAMRQSDDTLYEFIPVHVIGNDINSAQNYIIIDKGSDDGIGRNMGLVSHNGVAGVVCSVSRNYSMAISMLHPYTNLSVRFKSNQYIANLQWKTGSYQYGNIVDIPSHLVLNEGDTVVTSGHSFIFPPDIMVGVVSSVDEDNGKGLNSATIRFSTDMAALRNAYVVHNVGAGEIDSLSKNIPQ